MKVLHFLSDRLCIEYRTVTQSFLPLLHGIVPNRLRKGHMESRQGAPDGVGGVLKRLADDLVSKGSDIPDARSLFSALARTGTSIKPFYVEEEDIEKAIQAMPQNIPPVPSTKHLHQAVTQERGSLI